jgi:hypothetical protein
MANFKSVVVPAIGTTKTTVLTASRPLTIIGVSAANVIASSITVSVTISKGATVGHIIKNAPISAGDTLLLAGGEQKIVLETGDVLEVISSAASSVDVIVNYLEV